MHITRTYALGAWLVLLPAVAAFGQFSPTATRHGMFGPRALGGPLAPKPSRFSDGLMIGPSGTFEGIRHTYPWLQKDDIGPLSPEWSVYRDTPLYPTTDFIPAPYDLETTLNVLAPPVPPAAATVAPAPSAAPSPAPAAPAQPAAAAPELPLRRVGAPGMGQAGVAPEAALSGPAGPAAVSPLQVPGAPYTTFRPAFQVNGPNDDRIGAKLARQLTASPRIQKSTPIQVEVKGQTAILRGTVASEHDRRVAEQAVRMEAGIWNVQNKLVVGPPSQ